jgi:dipeptidase E
MRQIIALGGGGFSMEPDNPLLDLYILKQAKKPTPKICFIPTASGDSDHYISRYYNFFNKQNCNPSHLSLFKPPTRDLEGFLLEKDIIYVGGGNTRNLLALWKEWGLDNILRKAWNQGIVLAGVSAGSICWLEEGVTDSFGEGLEPIKCLGFLKGSNCHIMMESQIEDLRIIN